MKTPADANPHNVIPDFFENPIVRPYLSNVRSWQGYIRFLGLPDRRENPDILIDRLFVEPLLTRRYVSPDEHPNVWSRAAETVLDALTACNVVVILGDPGIGKSTLLNYVAWSLSRPASNPLVERLGWALPLPMVLREIPIRGVTDFDGLLSAFLAHAMSAPLRNDGRKYLDQMLAGGNVFLLLDGIDEVGDQRAREDLRAAVFDGLNRFPNCRWLLSSRIVGYDEVPFDTVESTAEAWPDLEDERRRERREVARTARDREISNLYVAPFDDTRIAAFARHWYSQRDAATGRASENAHHLVRAIHADDSIHRLARVPNLLTMMALIHRIEATLPHGRALLYDRITEAYLESIDKFRGIDSTPHDLPRKKGWLARVGLEMQRRRSSANDTESAAILVDFDTVHSWLTEEMARGNNRLQSPSAREFLEIVARRSGLFLPRGTQRYAFVHLSFQEYFAGVALQREVTRMEWARNGNSRLGFDRVTLAQWAGNSLWRETFSFVFELLAAQEETDWHTDLLECVFGEGFHQLNILSRRKGDYEKCLNLSRLAGRLVVNSRSGLSEKQRNDAIVACVGSLFRMKPKISASRDLGHTQPEQTAPWTILVDLLGNDDAVDGKVFDEIHHHVERTGTSTLSLNGARVSDLTPLANLTTLKVLELDYTRVSDLTPLANLTALEELRLNHTSVSDLTPLTKLTRLKSLQLDGTKVSDITPLANLTALEELRLKRTSVSDLTPLTKLTKLKWLFLGATHVSDLTPLASLTALYWLDLDGTKVSDLNPLTNLSTLVWLQLGSTPVSDIAPLATLTALEYLFLDRTQVSDPTPLSDLTALTWLELDGTMVSDLSPLTNLTGLRFIYLDDTKVSDLAPLSNLVALEHLRLKQTLVSDLSPLSQLAAMKRLALNFTPISDLTPLAGLTGLNWLELTGTRVSDLSPLSGLTALEWLHLAETAVSLSSVNKLQTILPSLHILFDRTLGESAN